MKVLLPKQHGAWAMLIIPYWLSVIAAGFHWIQIPFFVGWFFIYLATNPLLTIIKTKKNKNLLKWVYIYGSLAVIFMIVPVLYEPKLILFGVILFPLFIVNIYFARTNNERDLINDIVAIIVFCVSGLIAAYLSSETISEKVIFVSILCFLFFLGTVFFVKTMIREKNNITYKWISWIYHIVLVIVFLLLKEFLLAGAFLFSAIRAIVLYGKKITIKKVGMYEIANSCWFSLIIIIYLLI